MSAQVNGLPRIAAITAAALALSLAFFAPRLWILQGYVAGTFQWDRAQTFLLQSEEPMRRDIEPAMQWRLLPPLVAHAFHLRGHAPLAIPWVGVAAATAYAAVLFRRRLDDWRFVAGGTLLFATTSAILVPVGWLGVNDAWVWLGLLAVAFGRARWVLPVACLLCPWVDERFIIGFPLAFLAGRIERKERWNRRLTGFLWLAPYAAARLWLSRNDAAGNAATAGFLEEHARQALVILPMAPLGLWMGLRAAWLAIGYAARAAPRAYRLPGSAVLIATVGISIALAADLSRSVAILIPVVFLGCFEFSRRQPETAAPAVLLLGIANLVIPAAHVVHTKIDLINPLPVELFRLLR